jgi:hypothetical protein
MFTTVVLNALAGAKKVSVGAADGGFTVTVTVAAVLSGTVFCTETINVRVVAAVTFGAVKLGVAVFAPLSATAGPPVWVQANVKGRGGVFGSLLVSALKLTC